jgi:hypothetical protein
VQAPRSEKKRKNVEGLNNTLLALEEERLNLEDRLKDPKLNQVTAENI